MSRGLYFEEMEVGQTLKTPGRTINEADIVNFAGVTGDFNPLHLDAAYAAQQQFGQRIAHGLLGLSVSSGQSYSLGYLDGTVIAFTELTWKFRAPIYIGDTIYTISTISKTRAMPAAGGGFVTFDVKVLNQDGVTVQKGTWTVLVKSRDASALNTDDNQASEDTTA